MSRLSTMINQMAMYLRKISKYGKLIITILTVVLFLSVYQICEYFYPLSDAESVRNWWYLKVDLYLFIVGMWIVIASMKRYKDIKLARIQSIITAIGIGFAISNFIDRRFIGDRVFGTNDLFIIIVVVFVSQINLKKTITRINKNL